MKKILGFLAINLLLIATVLNAQVTVEVFPADPQSGPYNYFGVRVTLAQIYNENVTVTGFIYDEGNGPNTNNPFSLTVVTGDLTAETASNFYQTGPASSAVADIGTIVIGYAGVSITYEANGCILNFNSMADVNAVINQLLSEDEDYNDDYDSQYPNLTEDQLDDMDEQNGFDEYQKFRDFENLFGGFCSKRVEIEGIENTWLANNFTGTDPDEVDLTFDEAENTIFNTSYSFKIGSDVYQMTISGFYKNGVLFDDGESAGILNKKENVFYSIIDKQISQDKNSGPFSFWEYSELQDFIFKNHGDFYNFLPTPCKSNKKKKESAVFSNNTRRIDFKIAINSFWFASSVKAVAVSYKKNNGTWRRKRTKMAVSFVGTVYEGDCNGNFSISKRNPSSGFNKRKRQSSVRRSPAQVPGTETNWKTYSGLIVGAVDAPDINFAGTVVLTF